jgi:outer membrane protein
LVSLLITDKGLVGMKLIQLPAALAAGVALCLPLAAHGADLTEIYHRALRSDPQLREAEATRSAALEAKPQALGALLPQLSGTGGYTHDIESISQYPSTDNNGNAVIVPLSTRGKTYSTTWSVQLRQTLFRWDQFATLRQADARTAQAEVDFRAAQQNVIVRTATAYFNVLAARDTLDAAQASSEAIVRQLEQAEKRFEVGLIAITDVEEARAAADQPRGTSCAKSPGTPSTNSRVRGTTCRWCRRIRRARTSG